MIKRIIALERKYKEAMERIEALEARLDLLQGKPRGPITMTEARIANERGDRATVELFNKQWVAENMKGGTTAGIGQRGGCPGPKRKGGVNDGDNKEEADCDTLDPGGPGEARGGGETLSADRSNQ